MKACQVASILVWVAMMSSCAVLSIHRRSDSVNGVPFFVRTAVCRHELTWLEPIYALTLQSVTTQDKKETVTTLGVAEFSLSAFTASRQDVASLKSAIVNDPDPLAMWTRIQSAHAYNPLATPEPKPEDIVLVSNVNKPETTVDYRDTYYFNAHRPILGTAKADIKLANDGTMTEGSGEMESKTLQSFLDLLPIKALISKAAGLPLGGAAAVAVAPSYRLQVESRAIKHTHYRFSLPSSTPTETECPALPPVAFNEPSYNRERQDAGTEKASKEADKNTVKVNGEIKLPQKD